MSIEQTHFSSEDWETSVGTQLRSLRIASALDQAQLADRAGISIGALRNLERGNGSTLKSLVQVLRALGRESWLNSLAPTPSVSPLETFRSGRPSRTRVYRPRS
jgi:transcriptional regulator with XRE-family HTH domain